MDAPDFATLFDLLPIGAYRTSPEGRQLRANAALVHINGYDSEAQMLAAVDDIAREWYVLPGRRDEFKALIERDGQVVNFVSEIFRHRTRERIWIRENAHAVRDEAGRLRYYEGTVEDITALRQAEDALAASERRFRALTEKAQTLTLVLTDRFTVTYASPAARQLLGREPAALVGECIVDWIHESERALARRELAEVLVFRNSGRESVCRYRHADGTERTLASLANNCLADPAVQGIVLNLRDVTEHEAAARSLRASQERFEKAFAASPDAIVISRLSDGSYLDVNETFLRLSGYTRRELIGRPWMEMNIWRSREDRDRLVAALRSNGQVRDFEAAYQGQGGRQGFVSMSSQVIELDGQPCLLTILRDITASRQAQAALQDSEQRLRLALEAANLGLFDANLRTNVTNFTPRYAQMLGYRPEGFSADYEAWLGRMHPDDVPRVRAAFQAYVAGRAPQYRVEFRQRARSGEWRWIQSTGSIVERGADGTPSRLLGIHADIHERKVLEFEREQLLAQSVAAQQAAEAARRQLDSVFDRVNDGFVALDKDWRYTYVNRRAARLLQREDPQDLLGKHIWTEYPEGVGQPFHTAYLQAQATQQPAVYEDHYAPWDLWFENRIYPSPDGLTIYFTEITERKRAELALGRQLQRLEEAEALAGLGSWEYETDTGRVSWSHQMFALVGLDDDVPAPKDLSHLHPQDRSIAKQALKSGIDGHTIVPFTVRRNPQLGPPRWFRMSGHPEPAAAGRPRRVVGTALDVTASVLADQALRESEARYRQLVDQSPFAIIAHQDGRFVFANQAAVTLFGAHSAQDLLDTPVLERVHPAEREAARAHMLRAAADPSAPVHGESVYRRLDGSMLDVQLSVIAITLGGKPALQGVIVDITERKRAERALLESQRQLQELARQLMEHEKVTTRRLAMALHDHLGQTLAATRLLFDAITAAGFTDTLPPAQQAHCTRMGELLQQAVQQVRSVLIDLRPPLLDERGLVQALDNEMRTRLQDAGAVELRLKAAPGARGQRWPADVEYSAFMVAREAIANAIRHANATRITCQVDGSARRLALRVEDDGDGAADIQERPGHLGLIGMRERARAIGATLVFTSAGERGAGTTVDLRWTGRP